MVGPYRRRWPKRSTPPSRTACSFAASGTRSDRAFAGTVDTGVLRTTDRGENWDRVSGIDDRVTAVTVSKHDPAVVWAGTEPSAVYRSADAGDCWERLPVEWPGTYETGAPRGLAVVAD